MRKLMIGYLFFCADGVIGFCASSVAFNFRT